MQVVHNVENIDWSVNYEYIVDYTSVYVSWMYTANG